MEIVSRPEWLGITCHVDDLNSLKAHSLLFDRLLIHRLYERYLLGDERQQRSLGLDPNQREAEFEYLNSVGLVSSGPADPGGEVCNPADYLGMNTENYFRSYSYSQSRWFAASITSSGHNAVCIAPPVQPAIDGGRLAVGTTSELVLQIFNPPTPSLAVIDGATQPGDVVELVIPRLPRPDELTPWEQILEFKNDPESRKLLLSLRSWIHRSTRTSASLKEIAAEIDMLIAEYESCLRMHEIESRASTLEIVVTTIADIAENLAKFRYGQLARMPFRMREKKAALLPAERNAPGREISYIVKANQSFAKNRN